MSRKIVIYLVVFLFLLNIFAWQEVFVLNSPHYLKVDFLNVGQGDSAFVQTPENYKILIDGGPNSSMLGKLSSLMPFWDKEIDLVILTHPESDHMQGFLDLLENYKADYILWSGVKKTALEYDKWINILEKQKKLGAKIIIAKAGQEIKAGNILIDVLFPLKSMEGQDMKDTSNDSCVVNKIIYGKESFLFTGDIDSKAEAGLVNSGENILSNVLKVSHHGSKYSTSDLFLENVKPKVAVISVGKDNSYGQPTPEVLQRLEKFGIKVFRTDVNGDVKFVSDGNNIKLIKK
ncbi:MAG: ComEC/Rec2 family competence protein [Candidatus Staskawiczbacteria bacterium]|nr:ComEC/Rec2 family competence protein [Candidatus Staskawiczbacteria bacterium]